MGASNVGSTVVAVLEVTLADEYGHFDELPPELRKAIQQSPIKIGGDQVARLYREALADGWTPELFLRWMRSRTTEMSERDLRNIYPSGYPIFSRTRTLR